ncbi:GspH/FimT family pseudopilin [Vibrio salinus]|uniref:GspH/FimT family pseudopilin n=1 Tax=Vibrio salinus TaxID=2899784 RepID=UPI001E5C741F|nr:GspH/FimT family pseudopilin [Vibrio salinus]MCE0493089.1 GspH/FimT family pseudopilin [Vibrio salinus]
MSKSGFTLIELCITTALLGIGFMLALPDMTRLKDNIEVRSCANEIYQLIQHAKALSVSQKQPFWLWIDNGNNESGWKLILSDSGNTVAGHTLSVISYSSYPDLIVTGAYLDNKMMFFDSRGKVSSGHITIQSRSSLLFRLNIVTFYGSARIRICAEGANGNEWPEC